MFPLRAIFKRLESLPKSLISSCISSSTTPTISIKSLAFTPEISKINTKPFATYFSIISDHLRNQKVDEARALFDQIPSPDLYLSTKMISSYIENSRLDEALKLFDDLPVKDVVVWNLMIKGCLDCGKEETGVKLFDEMPEKNVVSWTTMMNALLKSGNFEEAENLFWEMPSTDIAAWNAMIHGCFQNGRVEEAMRFFELMPNRNVISWTIMLSGLNHHGKCDEALSFFRNMMRFGVNPTSSTFSCAVTSCANTGNLHLGSQVHVHAIKLGFVSDPYATASLITFYANCRQIDNSLKSFNEKLHLNVGVWTSLLTGYGVNAKHESALRVFVEMIRFGVVPNQSSFTSALNSSCEIESVDWGRSIHGAAIKMGMESDPFIGNSLIVLYTKCGNINNGVVAFQETTDRNIVSWNAIIVGCAQHGRSSWALAFFTQMTKAGVHPDEVTFTGLLNSCSHSGQLQKGRHFFDCLSRHAGIEMKLEHYACMVDILCRNGKLVEARDLLETMPFQANVSVWLALLSGCRNQLNLEAAEHAAEKIFAIDPYCSAAYVLLSNIYAFCGRWADVGRVRQEMKRIGAVKQPGCSWVNQKGIRHTFVSGDRSHPLSERIYEKLEWLVEKLKGYGYVYEPKFVLHDVEEEQKEEMLWYHSERLAICFVLVSTAEGSTVTVMKNLRTCGDCHSAIALIARIVGREIVLRDSCRFHHFRDGLCSCGGHW